MYFDRNNDDEERNKELWSAFGVTIGEPGGTSLVQVLDDILTGAVTGLSIEGIIEKSTTETADQRHNTALELGRDIANAVIVNSQGATIDIEDTGNLLYCAYVDRHNKVGQKVAGKEEARAVVTGLTGVLLQHH